MCETTRFHLYNKPVIKLTKVNPATLTFNRVREIMNLSPGLAKRLLDNYDPAHAPIKIHGDVVVDGSRRVQAAVYLGITELEVATV